MYYRVEFDSDEGSKAYAAQKRAVRKPTERQKRAMGKGLKLRKG